MNWPPQRDSEADVSSASPSSERIEELPYVAWNDSNHSKQHMACSLSLDQGSTEQKFSFQIGTLNPYGINERFSFN